MGSPSLRGSETGVYAGPDVLYSSAGAGEQGDTAKSNKGHEQRVFDHILSVFFFPEGDHEGAKCVHASLIGVPWKFGVPAVLWSTTITQGEKSVTLRVIVGWLVAGALLWGQESRALTARQVIERIKDHVGVPWRSDTVDTFKAGDPETRVTGIAVTTMATYDVLVRSVAAHKNLIITHEPIFYSHLDETKSLENQRDPVWADKERFIKEHQLVVWRFHDHWHLRHPDGIMTGVVRALEWEQFQQSQKSQGPDQGIFILPEMTVAGLSEQMKKRLGTNIVRVVGDPQMKVTRVGLMPGAAGPDEHRGMLQRDDVEVLAIGEVPEWETIEYVYDAAAEGKRKALILLGHIPSEQPGMEYCAEWLTTFVREVPVEFISTRQLFWLAK